MKKIIFVLTLLSTICCYAEIRSEISRYKIQNDRYLIERELKTENRYRSFFDLHIGISSHLLDLITDTSDIIDNNGTEAEQEAEILKLLTKELNTERNIFIEAAIAVPLPTFYLSDHKIQTSLFAGIFGGSSLTIHNSDDALNPVAQTYIKVDKKMGISNTSELTKDNSLTTSVYYIQRQELSADADYKSIAEDDKLINTDELELENVSIKMDMAFKREILRNTYLLEVQELHLLTHGASETSGYFGKSPLFHMRYNRKFYSEVLNHEWFYGMHMRKDYSLIDGAYLGVNLDFVNNEIPIKFTGTLNKQFLTFIPKINFKHLNLSYTLKMPFENPQEDMWVSAIHLVSLSTPF